MHQPSEAEINKAIYRLNYAMDCVGDGEGWIRTAIWALERALPKNIVGSDDGLRGVCPVCKQVVSLHYPNHKQPNGCWNCGQALKGATNGNE